MGINGVSGGLRALLVDVCARSFKRVDERAHVPDVHFAGLGPARDIIWPRQRGEWSPRRKRLGTHTIYATKVWDGAIFEDGVLVQIVTIVVIRVGVITLWQRGPWATRKWESR